ncbi:MAG TPA: phosphotransferase [Acidimicrobiia bacterium]|nr:phosphotransferase [Acidimicrobiia bacterium]
MTAVLRAHAALREAGLTYVGRPTRAVNSTNEVWFAGPYVLRINPHPESRVLDHERVVLEALTDQVPAPQVIAYGEATFGEWLVITRVAGQEMSRIWPAMSNDTRKAAVTALGLALRQLHRLDTAGTGIAELGPSSATSPDCPHQLPAERLLEVLAEAAQLPYVDRAVMGGAMDMVLSTGSALDDGADSFIHGDLHFENVLVDDGADVTGIVDFEWARPGPADLDLDVLLHSLADPALHVATDYDTLPRRRDFEHVTAWLRHAYPDLFAHPRLVERLTLYRLSYDTRALLQQPPDRPADGLSTHHPYRRLRRVVEGRSNLAWILTG